MKKMYFAVELFKLYRKSGHGVFKSVHKVLKPTKKSLRSIS